MLNNICHRSLQFTVLNAALLVLTKASKDHCNEYYNYNYNYFEIKFPFRLRSEQPDDCGYPGFDIQFDSENKMILDLPAIPIKLNVYEINYGAQVISVNFQDNYYKSGQARQSLEYFHKLSTASPFRLIRTKLSQFTMMNCSKEVFNQAGIEETFGLGLINSLMEMENSPSYYVYNDQNYKLCPISGVGHVEDNSQFVNCTKLYNFYAPIESDSTYVGDFTLSWSVPNCTLCELHNKWCKLKNNGTQHETECYTKRKGILVKSIVIAACCLCLLVTITMVIAFSFWDDSDKRKTREQRLKIKKFLEDYMALKPSRFTYADIKKITEQFKNKLGQGSYGTVFQGKLSNDFSVAVKILNTTKGNGEEFLNEMATIGKIHHVNIVRLVGFCADGFKRALVYEFMPNGSLEKYISPQHSTKNRALSWEKLHDIALGIAKGIEYLHQGCDQRILHFDIKPHNIMLDQNFSPKISDFGLAKSCSKEQSIVSMTTARGTMGYIAPEVFSRNFGNVSYKSDVYSFGMLLLEMVGGRKNTNPEEQSDGEIYYPEWIYNLLEEGEDLRIEIEEEEDAKIAKKLAIVGLWCIQWHPIGRPTMKVAVRMLEGGEELSMPPNPFASSSSGPSNTISSRPARRSPLELEAIAE